MIPTPRGWKRVLLDEPNDALVLYPPGGPATGMIGYRERVRPLASLRTLIDQFNAKHPEFVLSAERSEPLVTTEGEYAAVVTLEGSLDGKPAQRDLGYVFGDDFYAHISGLALQPEQFATFTATVRELTLHDSHRLGVRRRRFLYNPPAGWTAKERGFITSYLAPGFPANGTAITVWPANPRRQNEDGTTLIDALLEEDRQNGFVLEHRSAPAPLSSHGLHGQSWEVIGTFANQPRTYRDLVVFEDGRYLYMLRLETLDAAHRPEHRKLFLEVVLSTLPLPGPSTQTATQGIDHWAL